MGPFRQMDVLGLDTVRELNRIGVRADSRVEEREGCVDVIVTIRTGDERS